MGVAAGDVFARVDEAATPLTPAETTGLIPSWISSRQELNDAEQSNIARAYLWAHSRRRDLLTEKFIQELHRRMLGDVWRWAGKFRTSERNIGIEFWNIPVALRLLLDDTRAWMEFTAYSHDEIAVRFHHRLVQIHPFANGNGRHSRLMADLLIRQFWRPPFSWGFHSLRDAGATRRRYIEALRAADNRDVNLLLAFARD